MTDFRRWLPSGRGALRFGLAGLLNALGTGVFYPYALLFFQSLSGLSLSIVGVALTVTALAALLAMSLVGRAVDRVGPRDVLVAASLVRAVAFVGYVLGPGLPTFVVLSLLVAVANRAEQVSSPALAIGLAGPGQTGRWLGLSRAVFNADIGGGALLASGLVAAGRPGFMVLGIANAASYLGTAALHRSLPKVGLPVRGAASGSAGSSAGGGVRPWRDGPYVVTALVATTVAIVAFVAEAAMPVFIVRQLALPAWVVGVLFAVNTIMLTLLYVPAGGWLERRNTPRIIVTGILLHAALPVAPLVGYTWSAAPPLPILVAGMVPYTIGELVVSQATLMLLTKLPPEHERGRYLAFHQTLIGAALAVVPVLVASTLAHWPAAVCVALVVLTATAAAGAAPARLWRPGPAAVVDEPAPQSIGPK